MVGGVEGEGSASVPDAKCGVPVEGGPHRLEAVPFSLGFVFRGVETGGLLPAERFSGGDVGGDADGILGGYQDGRRIAPLGEKLVVEPVVVFGRFYTGYVHECVDVGDHKFRKSVMP